MLLAWATINLPHIGPFRDQDGGIVSGHAVLSFTKDLKFDTGL